MLNPLKSLVKSFSIPAVFPEDEQEVKVPAAKSLRVEIKERFQQAYEGRHKGARLAW